jgi:hypothetical protein
VQKIIVFSFFILSLISLPIMAIDKNNKFAVKGAGAVTCNQYIQAVQKNGTRLIAFSSWVDGYLSFYNQSSVKTFDIAPWQSSKLISKALYRHCSKKPELAFFTAVKYMIDALKDQRLAQASELVRVIDGKQTMYFYKEIIRQMQQSLNKKIGSNLKVNGIFDKKTEVALRKFQKLSGLKLSKVPDQDTLQHLFLNMNVTK